MGLGDIITGVANLQNSFWNIGSGIYDRYQQKKNTSWEHDFSNKQYNESVRQYNQNFDEAVRQYNKDFNESVRQYDQNYAFNQAEALRSQQNFESEVARDQYNLENQYQIAVADASKAGLNPLALNGLGSSAFGSPSYMSAPSSSVGSATVGSSQGVSGSPHSSYSGKNDNNPLNLDLLANLMHDAEERAKDRKSAEKIASDDRMQKEEQAFMDFLTATEANSIRRDELTEQIRKNQSNESIARAVASETVRNNLILEELKRAGIENDKAKLALEQAKQDDTYQIALRQLEQQKIALENTKEQADKDRRMNYITRIFGTLLDAVSRIAGGMLKK